MERRIRRAFVDGDLQPQSNIEDIPFVGEYLGARMHRAFAPGRRNGLTIRGFVGASGRGSVATASDRIKRALQNDRANQCVRNPHPYRIADVNTMGWRAVVALLRVIGRGQDGHNLGLRLTFDPRRLRLPTIRSRAAKRSGCITRAECRRAPDMVFSDGLCMPRSSRTRGFDGIGRHPGQKASYGTQYARQSRYARHPSRQSAWRHPSNSRQRRLPLR